jgi:hypothetical protein
VNTNQKYICSLIIVLIAIVSILHNPFGGYKKDNTLYTKLEFIKHLREAYPEYSDTNDSELYDGILKKYPNFKTWIVEESNGNEPKAISIINLSTNDRLTPPPAYYGAEPLTYSKNAFYSWLDEPLEYFCFIILLSLVCFSLCYIHRNEAVIDG